MNAVKISYIIPVFNRPLEVVEAVNSIIDNGHSNYEIILINDASTDRTKDVCLKLSEQWETVRLISNETNRGPGYSRNAGLHIAQGDYCYFLDSDDLVCGETLRAIAAILEQHPDIDIVTTNHITVSSGGENRMGFLKRELKYSRDELLAEYPAILHTELWRHLFRTEFIRSHRLEMPEAYIGEDTCFSALSFLQAEKIYTYPHPLCVHKHNSKDSLVTNASRNHYVEGFSICLQILDDYSKSHIMTQAEQMALHAYVYSCVVPLLASIPFSELEHGIRQSIPSAAGVNEGRCLRLDLNLYRQAGGLVDCVYLFWEFLKACLRTPEGRRIYLAPAGKVSAKIAENLLLAGLPIAGFLDNHANNGNIYYQHLRESSSLHIFSFDSFFRMEEKSGMPIVLVLGASNTAREIVSQLAHSGLSPDSYICGLDVDPFLEMPT